MKSLGHRIKLCRTQKNLTQLELAQQIGVKRESVSGYEGGRIIPPVAIIISLCKIFDVTSDYLLGLQDDSTVNAIVDQDAASIIVARNNMSETDKKLMMDVFKLIFHKYL